MSLTTPLPQLRATHKRHAPTKAKDALPQIAPPYPPSYHPPLPPVDPLLPSHSFTIAKTEWSSADLTGRFRVRSYDGYEYILVVVHHGYIRVTPLKTAPLFLTFLASNLSSSFSPPSLTLSRIFYLITKLLPTSQPILPLSLFPSNTSLPTAIVLSRWNGQSKPPRTILSLSCLPIAGRTYSPNPNLL
jgi:hypothetical protein